MNSPANLIGISIGPGDPELITVKGLAALRSCDVLIVPQAKVSEVSVARSIVDCYQIPEDRFRRVVFEMNRNRDVLEARYREVADLIGEEVQAGRKVGFLTLGDALTYSTWIYTLRAVRAGYPQIRVETIPGVTSFAALAALAEWPLGEQKEQILTLPCPDERVVLRDAIEAHDKIVLMKIGKRLPMVLELLNDMGITDQCVLGRRVGMEGGAVYCDLSSLPTGDELGYFSTLLIRHEVGTTRDD